MRLRFNRRALGALAVAPTLVLAAARDDSSARGEYLYRAGGCGACHTDSEHGGAEGAGGLALKTAFGVFYAPNITPDLDTGIGRWREADFVRALRFGVNPTGSHYYPAFPYTSYTQLTNEDVSALWTYVRALKSVRRSNTAHELSWYLRSRLLLAGWKFLFFTPGTFKPQARQSSNWNRGAYLVTAVVHCGECHTPRNLLGGFRKGYELGGTRDGPDGSVAANITPDRKTGIGRWRESELVEYLKSGMTPDGDFAGEVMADVIERSASRLTDADRRAIAIYVLSRPAIEHDLRKRKSNRQQEFE